MDTEAAEEGITSDLHHIKLLPKSKSPKEITNSPEEDHPDGDSIIHRRKNSENHNLSSKRQNLEGVSACSTSKGKEDASPLDKYDSGVSPAKEEDEEVVPNGGWGWVVVFGASLIVVLVDTMGQCFGILFSTFLLDLNTTALVTAWIFNLYQFVYNMTGPVLGPLITQFGWRSLTVVFSFVFAVGTITSAFVGSPYALFFTYSLLVGSSSGMLSNISYLIVPHYFKKRRGLANGIIMAWDCGGQFIGAPLIKILQDEYTFKGATLILGGVILHCCIGAAVFHPVKWHVKTKHSDTKDKEQSKRQRREKENNTKGSINSEEMTKETTKRQNVVLRLLISIVEDLYILKSAKAITIALTTTVTFNGYLNFLAFVPFAMQEAGFTLGDAATCVSLSAICNMVTRLIIASSSDSRFFSFRVTMLLGSLVISGSMLGFTFCDSLMWVKVTMALWGCGVGSYNAIFNLVMIHYVGLDSFIPMFGASLLICGFGYLAVGPLAGYVRDASGSYTICMWVLTGVSFSSFLMWLFMPLAQAIDDKREARAKAQTKERTERASSV